MGHEITDRYPDNRRMYKIILRGFLFIIPILGLNQLFLNAGYLFSTKNEYVLIRNLKTHQPGKINVKVFGSSRIENGISPYMMEMAFASKGIEARVFNCGINGKYPGWGLNMQEEYFSKCDILLVELIPDRNQMIGADQTPAKLSWGTYLDQCLSYHLNHVCVIHHLPNLVSDLRGRLPIKYMYTHKNGWTETKYIRKENRIQRVREKVRSWAIENFKTKEYLQGQNLYIDQVRNIEQRTGAKLVFIRMPVNGQTKYINDKILEESRLVENLRHAFPESIFIDATTDTRLSKFITIEESHLEGNTALLFSYCLAEVIVSDLSTDLLQNDSMTGLTPD